MRCINMITINTFKYTPLRVMLKFNNTIIKIKYLVIQIIIN